MRRAWLAWVLIPCLSACGSDAGPGGVGGSGDPPDLVDGPLDAATGPPADDEAELTPAEKTVAEAAIEAEPLPPPEVPRLEESDETGAMGDGGLALAAAGGFSRLCFSPREDCVNRLLGYLQSERRAIDIAIYHLYDSRISRLLVAKQREGVRVRVLGDRHAYTIKRQHRHELDYLASNGVPVRVNRFRGLVHHKTTILHGLGMVEMGSMNYTSVASRKITGSNGRPQWNDELAFFTDNARLFARFRERFERAWGRSGGGTRPYLSLEPGMRLLSFDDAERSKPRTCYEDPSPDPRPLPDDSRLRVCFTGDQACHKDAVAPLVSRERRRLDVIAFRITVGSITDPILARVREGVPVRVIVDRSQYGSPSYPSLTRFVDRLLALGRDGRDVRVKATAHQGNMHMKAIIGSDAATWGSGNYTSSSGKRVRGCQSAYYQTEDAIVTRDSGLVARLRARFDEMWNGRDFADFDREVRNR